MHRILIGLMQVICAVLASITAPVSHGPFPAILSTLSASLNATLNPATIDAVTLCEVIILTNPIPIHGPIPPGIPASSRLTLSLIIVDPVTLYTTTPRSPRATLYIYQRHGTAHGTR